VEREIEMLERMIERLVLARQRRSWPPGRTRRVRRIIDAWEQSLQIERQLAAELAAETEANVAAIIAAASGQ
jgi:hypothetical protein